MKQVPESQRRRHSPKPKITPQCFDRQEHTGGVLRKKSVGPILLTEIIHPPGYNLPVHSHSKACFSLVLSGSFQETYGRNSFTCKKDTLLYRPSEAPHSDEFSLEGATALLIEPEESWIKGLRDDARLLTFPRHVHGYAAATVAMQIRREWNTADDFSDLIIAGLVLLMAGRFQRACKEERSCRIPTWLAQARERLHESSADPPTICTLAAAADVHPAHLAREFRRFFRCTPGEYLRQLRVAAACRLLAETRLPLLEIADKSGFANHSHFSRTFRRMMAMTPSQYRSELL